MRTSNHRSSDLQQLQQQLQQIVTDLARPRDLRIRHRKIPPKMPRGLCFYSRCKNAELAAFYKARTGGDVPKTKKRMTKKDLANELRKVDRRPWNYGKKSFRFQDLPPEMRNLVYRELLPVRSQDRLREANEPRCQTAILRSCKQLHSEAQSILYGDHEGDVTIRSFYEQRWPSGPVVLRETNIFSGQLRDDLGGNGPPTLAGIRSEWPAYLLKFERINLQVKRAFYSTARSSETPRAMHAAINQELSGLVSFLSASTSLKALTVTVVVHGSGPLIDDPEFLSMLRPLARLSPLTSVDFVGVPSEIKDQVLLEKENYTDTKHFFADFEETHTALNELGAFKDSVSWSNPLIPLMNQRALMDAALNVTGFVDDKIEKQLKDATAATKAFLASGIVDKVNRLARKKAKEIKQEAAKKVEELEAQRQKFIEMGKAAKDAAATEKLAEDTSTKATDDTPTAA